MGGARHPRPPPLMRLPGNGHFRMSLVRMEIVTTPMAMGSASELLAISLAIPNTDSFLLVKIPFGLGVPLPEIYRTVKICASSKWHMDEIIHVALSAMTNSWKKPNVHQWEGAS